MGSSRYVEQIRIEELKQALGWLGGQRRILEVGAGTGWQARKLSEWGHEVEAVDLADSNYAYERIWSISNYDGVHLPFESDRFDVVFSSNVLEHVEQLVPLLEEMRRVVKPGGYLVHVVPSASWRFWTTLTHYPDRVRRLLQVAFKGGRRASTVAAPSAVPAAPVSFRRKLLRQVIPEVHGLLGATLTEELWAFRKGNWIRLLAAADLQCTRSGTTGVFYTGSSLLGLAIPISVRRRLAHVLGSSCHLFVFRKN